jgi:hypothetical protein
MALSTRETYTDKSGIEVPVCEKIILGVNETVPSFSRPPVVNRPAPPALPMPDIEILVREVPPIRIIEARMSVTGVKVVELGNGKAGGV